MAETACLIRDEAGNCVGEAKAPNKYAALGGGWNPVRDNDASAAATGAATGADADAGTDAGADAKRSSCELPVLKNAEFVVDVFAESFKGTMPVIFVPESSGQVPR